MSGTEDEISAYEGIKREADDELYTMLDQGLGKRDAPRIIEIIERLIDARIAEALARSG